jgi:hypothetical protein
LQGATGIRGLTGYQGYTGTQGFTGLQGPTGATPALKYFYNWVISDSAGLITGSAYIVYKMLESFTISTIEVGMGDSGSGGIGVTQFEFSVLSANSLPTTPPSGIGNASLQVPAAGSGVMNTATLPSLSLVLPEGSYFVVTISSAPATPGNNATITLR